jgi:hypothetical protein
MRVKQIQLPLIILLFLGVSAILKAIEPLPERPAIEPSRNQSPSNDELDRMVRGLPHKAVENFTQSVQPILMNNCTSAACHGPQSTTGLRLQRIPTGQSVGRRLTQRNLYAVMQYIDGSNPLGSRFLTAPIAPHGTAKTSVFTPQQVMQYKRLVDWVTLIYPAAIPDTPEINLDKELGLAQSIFQSEQSASVPGKLSADAKKGRPLPSVVRLEATQADFEDPASDVITSGAIAGLPASGGTAGLSGGATLDKSIKASKISDLEHEKPKIIVADPRQNLAARLKANAELQQAKVKRSASPQDFAPKDSFDPEIFNRRYIKPATSENSSSATNSSGEK